MHQVYTDPWEPGAPKLGDVVVVVREWPGCTPGDLDGATGVLVCGDPWIVDASGGLLGFAAGLVQAIRRPTEVELAAWALAQHGGTHG